jgi:hypothetical protein
MPQKLSRHIIEMLCRIMATRDFEKISTAFDNFLVADAKTINEIAEQFIAETNIGALAAERFPGEDLCYRLTMDTFYASMLDYLCEKCPTLEHSVEHDIPSWIEANAPELARFNAETMCLAMPDGGMLEDIDPRLSLANLEDRQRAMMKETWTAIEARIDALLKAMGYAEA